MKLSYNKHPNSRTTSTQRRWISVQWCVHTYSTYFTPGQRTWCRHSWKGQSGVTAPQDTHNITRQCWETGHETREIERTYKQVLLPCFIRTSGMSNNSNNNNKLYLYSSFHTKQCSSKCLTANTLCAQRNYMLPVTFRIDFKVLLHTVLNGVSVAIHA